jgi:uncharacterized protein YyaL (SSP411 family)
MTNPPGNAASPFIEAHKENPVQWRAWGEDALAEAKAADKPILISIGYQGCHWCHVLNREAFNDAEIAAQINDNFIPILIDRDARPDLDQIYQAAAAAMRYQGGWPLNVFVNPDGVPLWVAGYHPREDQGQTPSFRKVLTDAASLYQTDKPRVAENAAGVRNSLELLYNRPTVQDQINLDISALRIGQNFDIFFGGLQGQMKFPSVLMQQVLWNAYLRTGMPQFSQLIFTTLDSILFGGLYDHVGGGFFRHAKDERWLEPSFEKMLAENAQLIELCTLAYQFNKNELSRQRVAETIAWLLREMKLGDVFAIAQASGNLEDEFRYYTWSEAEIDASLVGTFSARFKQVYGVSRDGNLAGRNLPRRLGNPAPANEADEALLAKQRELLLTSRAKRKAPGVHDHVTTETNAMTITALARAGQVFARPDWVQAATAAFDGIVKALGDGDRLAHDMANGVKGVGGFAEDYANMARAALQLLEITGDARFLTRARAWTKVLDDYFWHEQLGGYCMTASDAEPLFIRPRVLFDNPRPSANATMLIVLMRLALLTGELHYRDRGTAIIAAFSNEANRLLNASGGFLAGFEYFANALEIVVIGHRGHARTHDLLRAAWGRALPNAMIVQIEPGAPLPEGHPVAGREMTQGQPTAYVLQAGTCSDGITDSAILTQMLTLPVQMRQQQLAS